MMMFVNILSKKIDMKIDNIVIRETSTKIRAGSLYDGRHWMVYFYDNSGNEMERKCFDNWADAGEYAMKLETFWKYNKG